MKKCDGLGVEHFFSPDLVIKNEDLSISEGAIRGWDKRNFYYFHLIKNLSKHYDFDIDVPYKNIHQEIKEILLNGSGDEKNNLFIQAEVEKSNKKETCI